MSKVLYPSYRDVLLRYLDEDQEYIISSTKRLKKDYSREKLLTSVQEFKRLNNLHVKDTKAILDKIKYPRNSYIGSDGAEAISVIALHSNLNDLKLALNCFLNSLKHHPEDTNQTLIPAMKDRVLILQRKKQLYGTQWYTNKGIFFLYPVHEFNKVNDRRREYGLKRLKTPVDLAEDPEKRPERRYANSADQRNLSEEEFIEQTVLFEDQDE